MKKQQTFFSKQLKKIMFEQGLTQKNLADKLGIGQQMISFWLNGIRNPTITSINKISNALDVSTSYFLEENSANVENSLVKEIKELKKILKFHEEKMKRFEAELELLKIKQNKK